MRFKKPSGDIWWMSLLWMFAAMYVGITSILQEKIGVGIIFLTFGICAGCIWFDVRWVYKWMLAYLSFAGVGWTLMQFKNGLSTRSIIQGALLAHAIFMIYQWGTDEDGS